jgi:hypothetical protein
VPAQTERDKAWQRPLPFSERAKLFCSGIMTGLREARKKNAERSRGQKLERWLRHDRIRKLAKFLMKSPENVGFFSMFLFHEDKGLRIRAASVLREAADHGVSIKSAGPAIYRKLALKGEPDDTKRSLLMALQSAAKNGEVLEFVDKPNGQRSSIVGAISTNLSGTGPIFGESFLTLRVFFESGADLTPAERMVNEVLLTNTTPSQRDAKLLSLREMIRECRAKELAAEQEFKAAAKKTRDDLALEKAAKWGAERAHIRHLLSLGKTDAVAEMLLAETNKIRNKPVTEYITSLISIHGYALPSLEAVSIAYHHEDSVNDLRLKAILEKACNDKRDDVRRIARVHLRLPPEPEPVAQEIVQQPAAQGSAGEADAAGAAPSPEPAAPQPEPSAPEQAPEAPHSEEGIPRSEHVGDFIAFARDLAKPKENGGKGQQDGDGQQ